MTSMLGLADGPRLNDCDTAAHDVSAIVHGMVDAAGERGETDGAALQVRVTRAVIGYLWCSEQGR